MLKGSSREVIALTTTAYTSITRTQIPSFTKTTIPHATYHTQSRISANPPDLVQWVRKQGGYVHQSIKISQLPGPSSYGLGLVASNDIPNGSDLIALPPHIPLQFNHDDSSPSFKALNDLALHVPEELWAMRLGLKLLQERAKTGSYWWPYISNLPETYSVPIFFEGEDIANLQYAPLVYQVNKRCRFLLDFEKQVKDTLANLKPNDHPFGGQDIDASSLGWAMSAVSSRAFRLYGDNHSDVMREHVPMMLPLIDMCNHSFNPNASISQGQRGAENAKILVKVVAEKDIKKDEAVELNYGNMNNDLFLLDYGFVISANPFDSIELRYNSALLDAASVTVGVNSPYFAHPESWQCEILSSLQLDNEDLSDMCPSLKVTLGGQDLVDGRLLAASRVLNASDANAVCKHELSTLQSLSAEAPLGISNEVAALRTIMGMCVLVLKNFRTDIAEDEALLKQGVSGSSTLAIQFRMEKKLAIVNVMREMAKRVKLLQLAAEESTAAA